MELIDVLACARLTRLLTKDRLALPLRNAWITEAYERADQALPPGHDAEDAMSIDDDPPKGAYFISCPWCTSVWLAAGVLLARRLAPRAWSPVAQVLAMSEVAALATVKA